MTSIKETVGYAIAQLCKAHRNTIDVALRQQFLSDLASVGEWVVIKGHLRACRDPDDDKFLETALAGEAPCIVTGDADLLALDPFQGVRVLTPRRFVEFSQSLPGSLSP